LNFVFWNAGNRSQQSALINLISATNANITVLAEYADDDAALLRGLYSTGIDYYALPTIGCPRIKIFSDTPPDHFSIIREADRYSIRKFSRSGLEPILLALVHLPSKLYMSETDQLQDIVFFRQDIEEAEQVTEISHTIVLGDFNMNPYEKGMVAATGMHSLPCLRTALSGGRMVQRREYSYFYNPTWNLFGDTEGIPGTYYHSNPGYDARFWNILDQVILRPSIAKRLDRQSLRIVTEARDTNFLDNKGHPGISDHLPLFFSLDLSIGGEK